MSIVDFGKLLSALKVPLYVVLGIAIAASVALAAPHGILAALGLEAWVRTYRAWIGGAWLLSVAIFLSAVASRTWTLVSPRLVERWNIRQWRKRFHSLSLPEQSLLAEYVDNETTTRSYLVGDGVVNGLVAKKILYRAGSVSHPYEPRFDFNIQPWAWDYLLRHRELVAAGRGRPRDTSDESGDHNW